MARPSYIVSEEKQRFYREHGWVMLEDFISSDEVARIRSVLDGMVSGRISTARRRGDLGGHADRVDPGVENIIQITWPTDLTSELDESEYMRASRDVSEQLYGDPRGTWAMDMNQFLVKMVRQEGRVDVVLCSAQWPLPHLALAAAHAHRHAMAPGSVLLRRPVRPARVQPVASPR